MRVLRVGKNDWPLPIPIVRSQGKWHFDTLAGKEELLFRRIGANELGAIAVCRGYVSAQRDYASAERDGQPAGTYAQKIMSDPDKHNGLYWETKPDEPPSPAGPLVAQASAEGYLPDKARPKLTPYHGYYYRIVKAQGAAAHGGAADYLVDGRMVKGFALVAFPVQYQVSGVMTFIVNQDGVVYQNNLGQSTEEIASSLTEFDPDSSWSAIRN